MALINRADAGMAMSETDTFSDVAFQTGDFPQATTPEIVAATVVATEDLPPYSVVGRNADGELVLAVYSEDEEDAIAPIGITTTTVKTGNTTNNVAIYRSGMFNPDALNWDDSYDDDTKKRLAFENSQHTIFLRKPKYV